MSDEIEDEVEETVEEDFDAEFDETEPGEGDGAAVLSIEDPTEDFVAVDELAADDSVADEAEEEEEEATNPRARKVAEEEDDDEEQDPDDVEADLEAILRDRMAAADDDDEEEPDEAGSRARADAPSAPRNDEFVCESCFLLVNRSQFGRASDPRCPMGDPECPSLVKLFG